MDSVQRDLDLNLCKLKRSRKSNKDILVHCVQAMKWSSMINVSSQQIDMIWHNGLQLDNRSQHWANGFLRLLSSSADSSQQSQEKLNTSANRNHPLMALTWLSSSWRWEWELAKRSLPSSETTPPSTNAIWSRELLHQLEDWVIVCYCTISHIDLT